MRIPFIAGNWKMNNDLASARALAGALRESLGSVTGVELAVFPPALHLAAVLELLDGCSIGVGAQNAHDAAKGAFTGEISAAMVKGLGCEYLILGHSERRALFGETDESVNRKLHMALAAGLIPIVCVGETLEQREAGTTAEVVRGQVEKSLAGLEPEQMKTTVVAYEPVWAIGTGLTATPEQAQEVHAQIRGLLMAAHGEAVAEAVRIQYGGSVKPDNAATLMGQSDIDGALVGGASLEAASFAGIVERAGG